MLSLVGPSAWRVDRAAMCRVANPRPSQGDRGSSPLPSSVPVKLIRMSNGLVNRRQRVRFLPLARNRETSARGSVDVTLFVCRDSSEEEQHFPKVEVPGSTPGLGTHIGVAQRRCNWLRTRRMGVRIPPPIPETEHALRDCAASLTSDCLAADCKGANIGLSWTFSSASGEHLSYKQKAGGSIPSTSTHATDAEMDRQQVF